MADIAREANCDADALYRLLRALASVGVFAESAPRSFSLTPMGALLREDAPGGLRAFARLQGDDWHWQCWGGLADTVRTGHAAIRTQTGAADCFELLSDRPHAAERFDAAMRGYCEQTHAAIADAFDFSGARHIVDVGGGTGALLATVLTDNPNARGIVFDRAPLASRAEAALRDADIGDRGRFEAGDFFDAVPAGADLYLMSSVLHDWDDVRAGRILRSVARAMTPSSRLLVVENVVEADNAAHPGKLIDLEMLLLTRGRERSASEFRDLLAQAGLRCDRVIDTAVSAVILEARRTFPSDAGAA